MCADMTVCTVHSEGGETQRGNRVRKQICNSNNSMRFTFCTTSDMAQHFPVDRVSCKFKFNKYSQAHNIKQIVHAHGRKTIQSRCMGQTN